MAANEQDAKIGLNLARLRQEAECTQEELAKEMRGNYGYKWSKATVWAVETGERPLKLAEAQDVLKCLGLDWATYLPVLLHGGGNPSSEMEIKGKALQSRFDIAQAAIPDLTNAYFDFLITAASTFAGAKESTAEEEAEGLLDDCSPESLNSYYWGYLKDRLREYCLQNEKIEDFMNEGDAEHENNLNGYNAAWRRVHALLGDKWAKYIDPDLYYKDEE